MLLAPVTFGALCRARDRLVETYEPLSIAELAADIGISPFHFIRQFHALFGETPHQLRIAARIERAKQMLALDRESVTGVCLEVGFSSLGSFSSTFARRVGASPSAYRRQIRPLVQVAGRLPAALTPGCLSLFAQLPASAFRNFGEAAPSR